MDRTEASDAFNAGSIPVGCILFIVVVKGDFMDKTNLNENAEDGKQKFQAQISRIVQMCKESKKVMIIIAVFLFSVGLAYVFGVIFKLGVSGIWLAYAVDEISRGILYYFRWRKGRWRKRFKAEEEKFKNEASKTQPAPAI